MRKVAALIILSLAFLGACSHREEASPYPSEVKPSPSPSSSTTLNEPAPAEKEVLDALKGDQPFELFSLTQNGPGIGGPWRVLGSAKLNTSERNIVAAAVLRGIRNNDGRQSACFDPHHAILAGRYVLLICYECQKIFAWKLKPGDPVRFDRAGADRLLLTSDEPVRVLNSILKKHRITLGFGK